MVDVGRALFGAPSLFEASVHFNSEDFVDSEGSYARCAGCGSGLGFLSPGLRLGYRLMPVRGLCGGLAQLQMISPNLRMSGYKTSSGNAAICILEFWIGFIQISVELHSGLVFAWSSNFIVFSRLLLSLNSKWEWHCSCMWF